MKTKILTVAAALALSVVAFAQESEVTGGVGANVGLTRVAGDNNWNAGVSGGYDSSLSELIQLGGELGYTLSKDDITTSQSLKLLVGPTFNFGDSLNNAVFTGVKAGFGYSKDTGTDAATSLEAKAYVGKRWELFSNVSYKPSFEVTMSRANETNTFAYNLKLLALSVIF